jgi:hypothetical protein
MQAMLPVYAVAKTLHALAKPHFCHCHNKSISCWQGTRKKLEETNPDLEDAVLTSESAAIEP